MTTRARDFQRSKVYKAETVAFPAQLFGPEEDLSTTNEIERWLRNVLRMAQAKDMFTSATEAIMRIAVTEGRKANRAAARIRTDPILGIIAIIRAPRHTRTKSMMLHELAHCVVEVEWPGVAAHGPEFCSTYIDLVQIMMGDTKGERLISTFSKAGVKMTDYHMNYLGG